MVLHWSLSSHLEQKAWVCPAAIKSSFYHQPKKTVINVFVLKRGLPKNVGAPDTTRASQLAQMVKNLLAMQETQVRPLGLKDPQEKGMAIHSSMLAWEIPWTEEPGGLESMGLQGVRHDWATSLRFTGATILITDHVTHTLLSLDGLCQRGVQKSGDSGAPSTPEIPWGYSSLNKKTVQWLEKWKNHQIKWLSRGVCFGKMIRTDVLKEMWASQVAQW